MKRAALKARIEAARAERKRRRRKRVIKLILFMILLWLLLRRCDTGLVFVPLEVPMPGTSKSVATAGPKSAPPARHARVKPKKLKRLKTDARPIYRPPSANRAPWLAALRLQVAARSPRLARCFEGLREPGALTWTSSLDPSAGLAVDHAFEPRSGGALPWPVRHCLRTALTEPPFNLGATRSTRTRVSLVIEF